MNHSAEFLRCLEECDVEAVRRLWHYVAPKAPQPTTDIQALIAIHHARTRSEAVSFRLRAYSHAWLVERSLPSGLPDELKPKAERIYPVTAPAVGIGVYMPKRYRKLARQIQIEMENSVLESFADGITDPLLIRQRMLERRDWAADQAAVRLGKP